MLRDYRTLPRISASLSTEWIDSLGIKVGALQLAECLSFLHDSASLSFSDINPQNIFIAAVCLLIDMLIFNLLFPHYNNQTLVSEYPISNTISLFKSFIPFEIILFYSFYHLNMYFFTYRMENGNFAVFIIHIHSVNRLQSHIHGMMKNNLR